MLVPGTVMEGTVESLQPYGAFVDLKDGLSGLVHISQISQRRIKKPSEVLSVGDKVKVKILNTDNGKISLSIKAATEEKEVEETERVDTAKYSSKESFIEDVEKIQDYLFQVTGARPVFYRFPGGSANTVSEVDMQDLISWLNEKGITYFDWNIASGDAVSRLLETETIVENCVSAIDGKNVCIILMHDANNRSTTVEALSQVIEEIRMRGDSVFLPITDETVPIQQEKLSNR